MTNSDEAATETIAALQEKFGMTPSLAEQTTNIVGEKILAEKNGIDVI
jgi:hypothetical protein